MATDTNPNSRSPFVGQDGRLTKYGMDVIAKIYRVLNINGEISIIDSIGFEDEGRIVTMIGQVERLKKAVSLLEMSATANQTSLINQIKKRVDAIESDAQLSVLNSKISQLEKRLSAIEAQL